MAVDVGKEDGPVKGVSIEHHGDENTERGNWGNKLDFMLSCIGYAVGFGNLWRFPYLCYRNGGGAFLIPYFIMLLLAGLPLFFMELALGQFASEGPVTIWKICPLFKGIGFSMVVISGTVCVYYNLLMGYCMYYIGSSFASVVPWASCDNSWNTPKCGHKILTTCNSNDTAKCVNGTLVNATTEIMSPSEEFWRYKVLHISSGIDEMGEMRWDLAICLVCAWILIFFCLCKGIKTSGKVVYFTATFPYVVLIILFVKGLTLDGCMDGIKFYITPNATRLKDPKIWGDAAVQIFYSLGPAWGGLIAFSSYNKFRNNCFRDALVVAGINCGTSVFAGFVVFSVLGFMAKEVGKKVEDVVTQGPGLAFIAYPQAIALLPISPLWSFLFFFMLLTLGIDTQFAMMETVISGLGDTFPKTLRRHKTTFIMCLCMVLFILGLPMVSQAGIYILTLIDWYAGGINLMIVGLFECIIVGWFYGAQRFLSDIKLMIGKFPAGSIWWKTCWMGITPALIFLINIFSLIIYTPVKYGNYEYPGWAEGIGWTISGLTILLIPGTMVYVLIRNYDGSIISTLRQSVRPADDWGPALPEHRMEQYAMNPAPKEKQLNCA